VDIPENDVLCIREQEKWALQMATKEQLSASIGTSAGHGSQPEACYLAFMKGIASRRRPSSLDDNDAGDPGEYASLR
jgi:hypothetical protein